MFIYTLCSAFIYLSSFYVIQLKLIKTHCSQVKVLFLPSVLFHASCSPLIEVFRVPHSVPHLHSVFLHFAEAADCITAFCLKRGIHFTILELLLYRSET